MAFQKNPGLAQAPGQVTRLASYVRSDINHLATLVGHLDKSLTNQDVKNLEAEINKFILPTYGLDTNAIDAWRVVLASFTVRSETDPVISALYDNPSKWLSLVGWGLKD